MLPVYPCRVSQPFADPGLYASQTDEHGPAGHHTGIDFGSFLGVSKNHFGLVPINNRRVRAVLPGQVMFSEHNSWAGNWIGVYSYDRNLLVTYWHLSARMKSKGDWVQVFEEIGRVGNTGYSTAPHLHVQLNHGRTFDYHGHLDPQFAFDAYSRKQARSIYQDQPFHPNVRH